MDKSVSDAHYNKMVNTPVSKLVVMLGIPTTISMLVTNIYNMADTYFVGQLGNSAAGAVGIVFGLMAIIQAIGFMFGHGAGSIIARKLGAKDVNSAGRVASVSLMAAVISGILIGVLGFVFMDPLVKILGSTRTIAPFAKDYVKYILIATPFMMGSFVVNNILRYEGKANLAMIGLVAGALLNIIFDPIFIFKFNMKIEGAGLSTALSQIVSFLILLGLFVFGKVQSKLSLRWLKRGFFSTTIEIAKTGFPSLVRQGLNSVSTMVLNGLAGYYGGDVAVAAMSIVGRICFFIFAVGLGIGQGFQPVSGFNYGAKKYSRVKKAYKFTLGLGEILLGILAIVGFIFSGSLIGVFRNDPDVIRIGTFALRVQLIALFFQPLTICSNMLFQSIGANAKATFLAMLRSGLFFIPVIFVLSFFFGLLGVQIAQTVADILAFFTTLPMIISFMRKLPEDERAMDK